MGDLADVGGREPADDPAQVDSVSLLGPERGTPHPRVEPVGSEHNVEVFQAANGDYWIPMAQPYGLFVTEMMEAQRYPEVRLQAGSEILRPYDVATWTLPLQMGVRVVTVDSAFEAPTARIREYERLPKPPPPPRPKQRRTRFDPRPPEPD
mgnify:CR=1 FL=1